MFPPAGVIVAHCGRPKLHVVYVHVGGAHSELTDVGVKGELLKPLHNFSYIMAISQILPPHGAHKCHGGKLVVKHICAPNDPNTCTEVLIK